MNILHRMGRKVALLSSCTLALFSSLIVLSASAAPSERVQNLLSSLTLEQKIGQLQQSHIEVESVNDISDSVKEAIRAGRVSSFLNANDLAVVNELQRIAVEESKAGIPLLIARDVIHGYNTIFPIPLGQAASWNAELVERGARIAAHEAASNGIRWTFAPMLDISRDARWGRIAESFGEDPLLTSVMAEASVKGYQGEDLSDPASIAACAKHFIGYGAAEAGRDYNTTYIPEPLLHNQYLPPFEAAIKAGSATIMSAFNDLNGVPASISKYALNDILRESLGYEGVVVSDWDSIVEAVIHGGAEDNKDAAHKAAIAQVDIEMVSTVYQDHYAQLIREGKLTEQQLDTMVLRILTFKESLGLLDAPYASPQAPTEAEMAAFRADAQAIATQSLVLLKNEGSVLPLKTSQKIALIGPMADAAHDQMGTWVFDGDKKDSVTVVSAFEDAADKVRYVRTLKNSRDNSQKHFKKALKAAKKSDVIVFIAGEESALSGEAHSRADITLPGAQEELIQALKKTGKPLVVVIMAGRQIALNNVLDDIDGLIMAWHPGHMAGPAISDLVFGQAEPTGRLPVTWPKVVGQLPMYYNHKMTGRPPQSRPFTFMEDYPEEANQHSLGHATNHIDIGYLPEFPFGFGLSYSSVEYGVTQVDKTTYSPEDTVTVSAVIKNTGKRPVEEIAQLYIRDVAGSVTRPVRELKDYQRISLKPGEQQTVTFTLTQEDFMFYNADVKKVFESGQFHAWIAPDALAGEMAEFRM